MLVNSLLYLSKMVVCLYSYILEQVPLAEVHTGLKEKFSDLVAHAGLAALRILLIGHAMELKHRDVEKQYKDTTKDVEKWKDKATSLKVCLRDALKEKKAAEKRAWPHEGSEGNCRERKPSPKR